MTIVKTETELHHEDNRRKMVLVAAKHSKNAVEFVEIVGVLGLGRELKELLQDRPDLQNAVTKAQQESVFADILTISYEEED